MWFLVLLCFTSFVVSFTVCLFISLMILNFCYKRWIGRRYEVNVEKEVFQAKVRELIKPNDESDEENRDE
ncbi:hypothetical protein Zmor_009692 [Zophobas morio]|uniref:Uncharacterized protein n=1 Tax=Zophobas morio TaxID=2755281 RepID=A0AA38IM42_9CUCU|nr:hypothetical protein Zmor_009692 [Zophobas morio]